MMEEDNKLLEVMITYNDYVRDNYDKPGWIPIDIETFYDMFFSDKYASNSAIH